MAYTTLTGGTGGGGDYADGDSWTPAIATMVRDNFEDHEARILAAEAAIADHESRIAALEALPAPGLVLLEQHTASASAMLDFTSFISAAYDDYVIQFLGIRPANDGADFRMLFSTDGGATFETTNYASTANFHSTSAELGTFGSESDSKISLSCDIDNAKLLNGTLNLFGPGGSGEKAVTYHASMYQNSSAKHVMMMLSGWWTPSTPVTAVRFKMDTGDIAVGIIRAYGVKK